MLACVLLLSSPFAAADSVLQPVIDGDTASADIDLGGVSATLTIRFENVVGLNAANLGLSALRVDPLAADWTARLGAGLSLPAAFPLLVRIEPPASGGLSFSGVVSVELYTHDLQYTVGSPLRLYSAPLGGAFTDITTLLGSGSIRSGGTKPDFSEFLIVADLRPLSTVIEAKYTQLAALMTQHDAFMSAGLRAELDSLYRASLSAYRSGAIVAAIQYVEAFTDKVSAHSGSELPDVWRSARDLPNVAGALRATAATLRFSLTLASNAS